MIHDTLENAHRYDSLHPNFRSVFNILQALNLDALQLGHIELDGSYVFINVDEIKGKAKGDALLEAHRRYIDIQMPLSSSETFGWRSTDTCSEPQHEFDTEKDIVFYNDTPTEYVDVAKREFIIFFPEDAHAPCITSETQHRKLIVKVSVEPNNERPTL